MMGAYRLPTPGQRRLLASVAIGTCVLAAGWVCSLAWRYPSSSLLYKFGLERDVLLAGKTLGLAAGCLAVLQLVLVARVPLLSRIVSQNRLVGLHRCCGWLLAALALLHPMLVFAPEDLRAIPVSWDYWPEITGAVVLIFILATSILTQARDFSGVPHGIWKTGHRYAAPVLAGLLLIHILFVNDGYDGGRPRQVVLAGASAFGLIWLWIAVRPMRGCHPHRVAEVRPAARNAMTLVLVPLKARPLGHLAGQFVYVRIRSRALSAEEHPFTIASQPGRTEGLCLTVRCSGDWTRRIGGVQEGDTIYVQGPFGHFSPDAWQSTASLVFMAGGVGITPILSILRTLAERSDRRPLTLIWSNRTRDDMVHADELSHLQKALPGLQIACFFSREKSVDFQTGRVGFRQLEQILGSYQPGCLLFLCGPADFMTQMRRHLRRLGYPRRAIKTEAFRM